MDVEANGENINAIQQNPIYDDYSYKDYPDLVKKNPKIVPL